MFLLKRVLKIVDLPTLSPPFPPTMIIWGLFGDGGELKQDRQDMFLLREGLKLKCYVCVGSITQ